MRIGGGVSARQNCRQLYSKDFNLENGLWLFRFVVIKCNAGNRNLNVLAENVKQFDCILFLTISKMNLKYSAF